MVMKQYAKQIVIGLITGLLNGLFGAGGGSVLVPAMELFLDIDEKKSHATAIAVILLLSAVSSVFYLKNGFFDGKLWLFLTIGGMAGGLVGAKVLSRISKSSLKIIFGGIIMITAIKLLF